jgi:hypothetical protein
MRIEEIRFVPLPAPILYSIEILSQRFGGTVQQLKIIAGQNLGLARSARKALEKIVAEDDVVGFRSQQLRHSKTFLKMNRQPTKNLLKCDTKIYRFPHDLAYPIGLGEQELSADWVP